MSFRNSQALMYLLLIPMLWPLTSHAYARRGIRSVDFYNFTYYSESWGRNIHLKSGRFQGKDPTSENLYITSEIVSLKYADFNNDRKQEAAIAIHTQFNGSMPEAMDYYVYEYRDGKLRQLFHKWQEGPEGMCVKEQSLIITSAMWGERKTHCCPAYTETKVYRMRGGSFLIKSHRLWKNYPFQHPEEFERLHDCNQQ